MENSNQPTQIQIELSEDVAQGTYANLAIIAHSSSEFIIDFVRLVPGVPKVKVQERIILSPENAKRLLYALQDNIVKYEEQFGTVRTDQAQGFLAPMMGPVKGEA